MSAVHYVVRNDDDAQLTDLGEKQPAWHWRFHGDDLTRMLCRINSRSEAERLAAEHGGTVHRITVTDEAVGLRWVEMVTVGDSWSLHDGKSKLGTLGPSRLVGSTWCVDRSPWNHDGSATHWSFYAPGLIHTQWPISLTLADAKAAAEAAVKETWT